MCTNTYIASAAESTEYLSYLALYLYQHVQMCGAYIRCCHRPLNQQATDTHTHGFYRQHLFLQYWWQYSMWEVNVQKWHLQSLQKWRVPLSPTFTFMPKIIIHLHSLSHY